MFSKKNNDALVDSLLARVDALEQEVEHLKNDEVKPEKADDCVGTSPSDVGVGMC